MGTGVPCRWPNELVPHFRKLSGTVHAFHQPSSSCLRGARPRTVYGRLEADEPAPGGTRTGTSAAVPSASAASSAGTVIARHHGPGAWTRRSSHHCSGGRECPTKPQQMVHAEAFLPGLQRTVPSGRPSVGLCAHSPARATRNGSRRNGLI